MALETVTNMRFFSTLLEEAKGSTTRWGGRYVEIDGQELLLGDVVAHALKLASYRNNFTNMDERTAGLTLRDQLIELCRSSDEEMQQRCILVCILAWLRDLFHNASYNSLKDERTSDHYDGTASSMNMRENLTMVTKKEHDALFPGKQFGFDPQNEPDYVMVPDYTFPGRML